jgi:hypothetical protein
MTVSIDPSTRVITVQQGDLSLVTGTLYEHDTEAFRQTVNDLMAGEALMWLPDWADRNAPYTVFGATYAQKIEVINGFSIEYDDAPGAYSVNLKGSNNNLGDIQGGVLVQNLVQVIPTNSAGLVVVDTGAADTTAIISTVEDWGVINFSK